MEAAKYRRTVKCSGFGKKWPNSVDPPAKSYTCDISPDKGAVMVRMWTLADQDALRQQPRSDRRVFVDSEQSRVSGTGWL